MKGQKRDREALKKQKKMILKLKVYVLKQDAHWNSCKSEYTGTQRPVPSSILPSSSISVRNKEQHHNKKYFQ